MTGDIVAEQDDHVRFERIGAVDDLCDVRKRHPGIARVEIGDRRDSELKIGRPSRRPNMVARDAKPKQRLDTKAVGRRREASGAKSGNEAKETTTCEHGVISREAAS